MKTHKVYQFINSIGVVEYVGETIDPKRRFRQHVQCINGRFYGRQDLIMNIVAEFDNRVDARALEGQLKLQYGLEWTEVTSVSNAGKIGGASHNSPNGGKISCSKERICPHCNKIGHGPVMYRYHGEKCKYKIN